MYADISAGIHKTVEATKSLSSASCSSFRIAPVANNFSSVCVIVYILSYKNAKNHELTVEGGFSATAKACFDVTEELLIVQSIFQVAQLQDRIILQKVFAISGVALYTS